jgi:hypothetical protein
VGAGISRPIGGSTQIAYCISRGRFTAEVRGLRGREMAAGNSSAREGAAAARGQSRGRGARRGKSDAAQGPAQPLPPQTGACQASRAAAVERAANENLFSAATDAKTAFGPTGRGGRH